jgi:hypothetical protein
MLNTLLLGVMSIVFPNLGALKGGLELGYRNYRLGATLVILATLSKTGLLFLVLAFLAGLMGG